MILFRIYITTVKKSSSTMPFSTIVFSYAIPQGIILTDFIQPPGHMYSSFHSLFIAHTFKYNILLYKFLFWSNASLSLMFDLQII